MTRAAHARACKAEVHGASHVIETLIVDVSTVLLHSYLILVSSNSLIVATTSLSVSRISVSETGISASVNTAGLPSDKKSKMTLNNCGFRTCQV